MQNIPLSKPDITDAEKNAVLEVLNSPKLALGPKLVEFEKIVADFTGVKYAVAVNSGTSALHLIVRALGIKKGDEVITTPFSFIASANCTLYEGATPVFVDIDEQTFNMNVRQVERKITKKTKVILPVHLYGYPADMDAIMRVAKAHKLFVLEDAAQATGAIYGRKKVGTIGHINAFSFYPTKNLGTFGDGGAIATNDLKIAEYVRWIRQYGETERYKNKVEGVNSRLEELQAAILNWGLSKLGGWNKKRIQIAARYTKGLGGLPLVLPQAGNTKTTHAWHLYVIRTKKRYALKKYLAAKGIATGIHYPTPIHLQEAYRFLGHKKGYLPITEKVVGEILSLPIYPELTAKEQDYVILTIKKFFGIDK